jgi:hypothetical protein
MHRRRICTSRRPKATPPRHHPLRDNLHLGVAGTGRICRAPASLQCTVVPAGAANPGRSRRRLDLQPPRDRRAEEPAVLIPHLHRVSGAAAPACLRRRAAFFVPSQS